MPYLDNIELNTFDASDKKCLKYENHFTYLPLIQLFASFVTFNDFHLGWLLARAERMRDGKEEEKELVYRQ